MILLLTFTSSLFASTGCENGLKAFAQTLHPELVKSCSDCHGNESDAPSHSQDDSSEAYKIARAYADFNQLSKSTFLKQVKTKHWLEHDATAVGMSTEKMTALLTAWYEQGEKDCQAEQYAYVTSFVKIGPETDSAFKRLRWKMDAGTVAEVEIQKYKQEQDGSVSYRLRKPRIATQENLIIEGLYLVVNGETNPLENAFSRIKALVNGKSFEEKDILPFPVLSVDNLITIPRASSSTELALAFSRFEKAQTQTCKQFNIFRDSLYPEVKASCLKCHSGTTEAAQRLNMNVDMEVLCQEFTQRSGVLSDIALKGKLEHPTIANPQASSRFKKALGLWNVD